MKKLILLTIVMFYPFYYGTAGVQVDSAVNPEPEDTKTSTMAGSLREKITYLGVSVALVGETVGAQLKLPKDIGLVVTYVDPESVASRVLVRNDVLYKLNDQLLINPEQFAVLVKMFKPGDEISLDIFRAGAPLNVKAKLGERSIVPGEAPAGFRLLPFSRFYPPQKNEEVLDKIRKWLDDIGMEKDRIRDTAESMWKDIMETLRNMDDASLPFRFGRRREMDMERRGTDSKVVSVSPDGASYTDNEHRLVITRTERGLILSARDKADKVIFEGPVDSNEQMEKVPQEIQRKARELKEKLMVQPAPPPGPCRETM